MDADDHSHEDHRRLAPLLLACGTVGGTAAFALVLEKIATLREPSHVPSCDLNPIMSCGSVMSTAQAELFGFPNPLLGIVGFTIVVVTGVVLLGGAQLSRWYWLGLQVGVTFGMTLVVWLIFQSVYRIGALCPYCMAVWAVMPLIFWFVTRRNAQVGVFGSRVAASSLVVWAVRWQPVILAIAYLLLVMLILERFWFYWSTLL
ncbi:hypothetical protein ASG90_17165 [Nocardioides sp. Soil797]|nr:hypothetical protein ASG90_17165 [Nocardioides sp. Soil797]